MKYEVRLMKDGLWAVIAPSGQVAGVCPTRLGGMNTARGLMSFNAFTHREAS